MTEVVDHLLMWAHYADSHRGFAIRYDVDDFAGSAKGIELCKVVYLDVVPPIHVRELVA